MGQRNLLQRQRNYFRLPCFRNHNGNGVLERILFTISELHVHSVIRSTEICASDILRVCGLPVSWRDLFLFSLLQSSSQIGS